MDYEISCEEVKAKLDQQEEFALLDVREPWEFETAHMEKAKLIPMGDIPARAHQELDPEDHIVVVCHHGVRSMNVTAWLRQQGFEKAQSMRGGIDATPNRPDSAYVLNFSRMITDCHIHISPLEMFKPQALELMKTKRPNFEQIAEFCRSPKAFLKYLDACGIDRAALGDYVAPEVIGFTSGVNSFIAEYVKEDPKRLLSCGSLHPRHTSNVLADMEQILRLGIRMIKIHPPHQLLFPNDYLHGVKELEIIYRAAEANGVPVMFHTGTSIFPGARNKYGDPIYVDDVAVDFPKLKILLAHGGRPLWMQTAFFLIRRHANVYLDISGIPPRSLLEYFPRLDEIAHKTLFGTDWPGPGVPDVKKNLDEFRALPLNQEIQQQILSNTALSIWPA